MTDDQSPIWLPAPQVPLDQDGPTVDYVPFDLSSGPEDAILGFVVARSLANPDQVAIVDDRRSVSYREMIADRRLVVRLHIERVYGLVVTDGRRPIGTDQ